jgi:hypothetical protein
MNTNKLIVIHNFIPTEDIKNINKHLADTYLSEIKYEIDDIIKNKSSIYSEKSNGEVNLPYRWLKRDDNELVYELLDIFVQSVKTEAEESFGLSLLPENGYSITSYVDGDELPEHYDGYGSLPTPNGNPKREISSVLYLNEDFDGGEICFPNQGINLKPKPGMLAIFPANQEFVHFVTRVNSGFRYTVPQFWSIDRPR